MDQQIFNRIISDFLLRLYPEFLSAIDSFEDGSLKFSVRSPSGEFAMWIATFNQEITYGIVSPDGQENIHSHISCHDFDDSPGCFRFLAGWINDVRDNRTVIYQNDSGVWDWIDQVSLLRKEVNLGKFYKKYFWSSFKN